MHAGARGVGILILISAVSPATNVIGSTNQNPILGIQRAFILLLSVFFMPDDILLILGQDWGFGWARYVGMDLPK